MFLRVMSSLVFPRMFGRALVPLDALLRNGFQINKTEGCRLLCLTLGDSQNILAVECSEVSFTEGWLTYIVILVLSIRYNGSIFVYIMK